MTRQEDTTLRPGDVVVADLPTTDLKAVKRRPALVLSVNGSDVLVAEITSKHNPAPERRSAYAIKDWQAAGLRMPSYVRPTNVMTLHASLCRRIGSLPESEFEEVRKRHARFVSSDPEHELNRLRHELQRWKAVAQRLPGNPRTPEELALAIDNMQRHIRRLEQALLDRRSGPGPVLGR